MTRAEIANLLEIMAAAYPNAKLGDAKRMVDAWELAFGKDDAGEVYKAARHHLNTCRFFPTIADIQQCRQKGKLIYSDNSPLQIENKTDNYLTIGDGKEYSDQYMDILEDLGFGTDEEE